VVAACRRAREFLSKVLLILRYIMYVFRVILGKEVKVPEHLQVIPSTSPEGPHGIK
jgi:hypothetical protein